LGHSDSEIVGSPTRLYNENGESAREEFSPQIQEGIKPETTRSKTGIAIQKGNV
jgi:hypothetical protein